MRASARSARTLMVAALSPPKLQEDSARLVCASGGAGLLAGAKRHLSMRQPLRCRTHQVPGTARLDLSPGSGALPRAVASREACPTAHEQAVIQSVFNGARRKATKRLFFLLLFCLAAFGQPAAEAVLRHAIELHQAGDIDGAIREYRAYLKQKPDNLIALSNLGAALSRSGHYEEATVEYRRALKIDPSNLPVQLNLALAYYKASRISDAAAELEKVVKRQPDNRQAIFLLADCDLRLGENRKVIALLDPLEKQSPGDQALNYLLGTALIRDNQAARGQVLVDRILRDGDSAEARLLMGAAKMNAQDYSGALVDLQKAVELNPKLPDLYSYYGLALMSTGDTPGAAVAFRKELESNPNDFVSNLQLGALLKQEQDFVAARQCFDRALMARPTDPGVRYQIATLDLMSGKVDEARGALEKLVKESPQFVEAHVSLATVYYRLKRKEDGDRERAIVLQLNNAKQASEPGAKVP